MKREIFLSLYNLLYPVSGLLLSPFLIYKISTSEKYKAGLGEKLGLSLPEVTFGRPRLWIHAVSVGEVLAVDPLARAIKARNPDLKLIFSTTTLTGMKTAKERLSDCVDLFLYFPLDFYPVVRKVLNHILPDAVVIVETEIWPSFLFEASRKKIPVFLINGRLSDSSFKGYSLISPFISEFLKLYEKIFARSEADAARFVALGAPQEKVVVTGNIKYVSVYERSKSVDPEKVRASLGVSKEKIFCAGSTHSGEEKAVLRVFKKLKGRFSDLKLILAPRHPERSKDVAEMVEAEGLCFSFFSASKGFSGAEVLIVDTVGRLFELYSVADAVFVGGSLVEFGGHNPLEPLVFLKPVAIGPFYFNFRDVVEDFKDFIAVVRNENELLDFVLKSLKGSVKLPREGIREKFLRATAGFELVVKELEGFLKS